MLKFFLIAVSLLVFACSGEKYNTSKAIHILPEKTDSFIPSPELSRLPIYIEGGSYIGTLTPKKLVKLRGIDSNFELISDGAIYVSSSKKLVKVDFDGKKVDISFKKSLSKKNNAFKFVLAVSGDFAVVSSTNGDVMAFDTSQMKLVWQAKIEDLITIKPFIYKDEVLILTSSGGLHSFDIFTGKKLLEVDKVDDPIGINFNTLSNLEPLPIYASNLLVSYYRTDLLFFDISTKIKLHTFSLLEGALDFGSIKHTPVFYGNAIIAGTSHNLSSVSLLNGIKIWDVNGNFTSNIAVAGGFAFAFEKTSENLLAFSVQNGSIKWKTELDIPKKTSKVWVATFSPNALLVIDEKGYITKVNIVNGNIFEEKKRQVAFSPKFNYRLTNGKIYYTDGSDNLIVLE